MKILILSDTHGAVSAAEGIIRKERPDHVIHLGDCLQDAKELAERFPTLPICRVPGNNDFFSDEPKERAIRLEDAGLFLCHGHTTGVKNGDYSAQWAKAYRNRCTVSLFGHTHVPHLEERDGILLLNPGAAERDRYAILTLCRGKKPAAELKMDQ